MKTIFKYLENHSSENLSPLRRGELYALAQLAVGSLFHGLEVKVSAKALEAQRVLKFRRTKDESERIVDEYEHLHSLQERGILSYAYGDVRNYPLMALNEIVQRRNSAIESKLNKFITLILESDLPQAKNIYEELCSASQYVSPAGKEDALNLFGELEEVDHIERNLEIGIGKVDGEALHSFISAVGKPISPEAAASVNLYIPELKMFVYANSDGKVELGPVCIPLSYFGDVTFIPRESVFGLNTDLDADIKKSTLRRIINEQDRQAFYHSTFDFAAPLILNSGKLGAPVGSYVHRSLMGVYVGKLTEASDEIRADGGYVKFDSLETLFVFGKDTLKPGYYDLGNNNGYDVIGKGVHLSDPNLVAILVGNTLRESLLRWIDTWPEEKVVQTFGQRVPADLIKSV